jgi:hypothetical protein
MFTNCVRSKKEAEKAKSRSCMTSEVATDAQKSQRGGHVVRSCSVVAPGLHGVSHPAEQRKQMV